MTLPEPDLPPVIKKLPTPTECLLQAANELMGNEYDAVSAAYAGVWLGIARELREGSQRPLVERALDRLTLHDVEAIVCAHGRCAVRRKGHGQARWFLHTDDGSNCAQPDEGREHLRRRTGEQQSRADATEDGPSGPDAMMGYRRGQADPPSFEQYRYALRIAQGIANDKHPLPDDLVPAAERLAAEVIERGQPIFDPQRIVGAGPDPLLAGAMPRTFLSQPVPAEPVRDLSGVAKTLVIERSACRPPCNQGIHKDSAGSWVHSSTGQAVCPSAGPMAATTFAEPVGHR